MSLQQVVYISKAAQDYSEQQLSEMLQNFRDNNQRNQITGILLYKNRKFMQLLEGEKHVLHKLLAKIKLDQRHEAVVEIYNMAAQARRFADWNMSFYDLHNPQVLQIPGYSNYLDTDLGDEIFRTSQEAIKFLHVFKYTSVNKSPA